MKDRRDIDFEKISEVLTRGATDEDSNERRYFLAKVERGLEQSEGETISPEEIKARFLTIRHYAEGS